MMDDMIPPEGRRSIQDVATPARSRPIRFTPMNQGTPPPPLPPKPPQMELKPERSGGMMAFIVIAGAVVVIAGAVVGIMSTIFHRAYVTVTPYEWQVLVDDTFQASEGIGAISYQTVTASKTATQIVPATGTRNVQDRASGTITVYNVYSTGSQRLITNTRFATPEGLVYRIHEPITVPGYKMQNGTKVPGSIDVVVYADEAGDTYNIGLVNFTIPGLKGSDQYTTTYAKSKTPMTGGFVGEKAVVDEAVRASAVSALKSTLDSDLRAHIVTLAPDGMLIVEDTVVITYSEAPDQAGDTGEAVVSVTGMASAPALLESALARAIAGAGSVQYEGALQISNPEAFTIEVKTSASKTAAVGDLDLVVNGDVTLTPVIDLAQLSVDLSGKMQSEVGGVISQGYPGIKDIQVKVYPFWRKTLPSNSSDIKAEINMGVDPAVEF